MKLRAGAKRMKIGRPTDGARRLAATLWIACGFFAADAAARAEAGPCPVPAEIVRVAAVVDDLDLALEDGRTLRLAGLDPVRATPSHPAFGEEARHGLEGTLIGRDIAVAIISTTSDRWDRWAALVADPTGSPFPVEPLRLLNGAMIDRGWARVRPERTISGCLEDLLDRERKARTSSLGLWADPYYSIIAADDSDALAGRTGALALVQGRARLHESRGRIYLDLGRTSAGVAAVLDRIGVKSLARAGLTPSGLAGATLLVRGFLDDRFGPRIDVTDASQIEVVDRPPNSVRVLTDSSGADGPDGAH